MACDDPAGPDNDAVAELPDITVDAQYRATIPCEELVGAGDLYVAVNDSVGRLRFYHNWGLEDYTDFTLPGEQLAEVAGTASVEWDQGWGWVYAATKSEKLFLMRKHPVFERYGWEQIDQDTLRRLYVGSDLQGPIRVLDVACDESFVYILAADGFSARRILVASSGATGPDVVLRSWWDLRSNESPIKELFGMSCYGWHNRLMIPRLYTSVLAYTPALESGEEGWQWEVQVRAGDGAVVDRFERGWYAPRPKPEYRNILVLDPSHVMLSAGEWPLEVSSVDGTVRGHVTVSGFDEPRELAWQGGSWTGIMLVAELRGGVTYVGTVTDVNWSQFVGE